VVVSQHHGEKHVNVMPVGDLEQLIAEQQAPVNDGRLETDNA
jgi:hypothetical protein